MYSGIGYAVVNAGRNLVKSAHQNLAARGTLVVQKFFLKNIFSVFIFKNIFANEEYFSCLKREYGISF